MREGLRTKAAIIPALTVVAVAAVLIWRLLFAGAASGAGPTSFSLKSGGYSSGLGFHPADILVPGPAVAIPCQHLGLICTDPATGLQDDIDGLSYGVDFSLAADGPATQFAVAPGAAGVAGTAVNTEMACGPSADIFNSNLDGNNAQLWDGNGAPCAPNAGLPLGLCEALCPGGAPADQVDGIAPDPSIVDPGGTGTPALPVYLTLAPGSPSLLDPVIAATDPGGNVTPADILTTVGGGTPTVWADGALNLGLNEAGDVIDAICVQDNGNGIYDPGDKLLFSLRAGSPTLGMIGASPADLLAPGPVVAIPAARLGLRPTDDLDGLSCPNNTADLSITKTGPAAPVNIGVAITYTLTAMNNGPDTATGVTITDTLPANVTFVSAPAICTQAGGVVTCNVGTLLNGGSATVAITVTASAGGPAMDTATVVGNEYDLNPGNNKATQTTSILYTCTRAPAAGGATVHTPWVEPPMGPPPVGGPDDDCDGFSNAVETFDGTNPEIACAVGALVWPPDFNNDTHVNLTDVVLLKPHFNTAPPNPNYSVRFDLNASNSINLTDVVILKPFFNLTCIP